MRFDQQLIPGILIERHHRFLAEVRLEDGTVVTAHCPNSGRMTTCAEPGFRVLISRAANPARRLAYTWELAHNGQCWIGINTGWPPKVAAEAITAGSIPELAGYANLRAEVPYGSRRSRIDLLLTGGARPDAYVEVKSVTLVAADGSWCFPDAVTERGRKHLLELMGVVRAGGRGVMLYVIQRADDHFFRPAWEVDPEYAKTLRQAVRAGVEMLAWRAEVGPAGIELAAAVPWRLSAP